MTQNDLHIQSAWACDPITLNIYQDGDKETWDNDSHTLNELFKNFIPTGTYIKLLELMMVELVEDDLNYLFMEVFEKVITKDTNKNLKNKMIELLLKTFD